MAYATYTTEALVCGSYDRGDANRSLVLFTKDAGMLYAEARSVREERSKQRCAVQDFSYLRVSLVRGKAGWRVGSVEVLENFYFQSTHREVRAMVLHIVRLLRRFIHGEEPHQTLFTLVIERLQQIAAVPPSHRSDWTLLTEVAVLGQLGYLDGEADEEVLRQGSVNGLDERRREKLVQAIQHAHTVSHL